jgi:hypothetical protein
MSGPVLTRQHAALVHILIEEDKRLEAREKRANIYRIGHYLKGLEDAEAAPDIVAGLLASFTHTRMRDKLLRAAGQTPCGCSRRAHFSAHAREAVLMSGPEVNAAVAAYLRHTGGSVYRAADAALIKSAPDLLAQRAALAEACEAMVHAAKMNDPALGAVAATLAELALAKVRP